jgi:iron-sulfur cluster repair protein YtfE (RIC family)
MFGDDSQSSNRPQEATPMNAIDFLKAEHRNAKAAFGKLLRAPAQDRDELWEALKPELELHEQIEESCLYIPLAQDAGSKNSELATWVERHREEVDEAEAVIQETDELNPEEPRWMSRIKKIHSSLENHIREEEEEIFPRISGVWDDRRLAQAGREMSEMKEKTTRSD